MIWRDESVVVEVPVRMLCELSALADGYTMRGGQFINRSVLRDARNLIFDVGYENWDDEPLPGARDWTF